MIRFSTLWFGVIMGLTQLLLIKRRIILGILTMTRHVPTMLSRNRDQTIIALSLVIVTFTLLFMIRAAEQTGDSLHYAYAARTGIDMFHPHHLLYTPIVHLLFRAFSVVFESCDVIFAAQFHNIIWAAVAVVALYFIVRHLLGSSLFGILAAICLLVCQGFWIYSTQVEVYIPAIGCVMLLLVILVVRGNANLTTRQTVGISLLLAMAVLYQQAIVLLCIPLVYYFIATQGRQGLKPLAAILSIAGAIVLSTYIIVFISIGEDATIVEFLRFCLSHFENPTWGTFKHYSVNGVVSLFNSQAWDIVSIPGTTVSYQAAIFSTFIAFLSVWNIVQIVKHAQYDKLRGFMLIWLIVHLLYFLWWHPWRENLIVMLIPLLLLTFITLMDITYKVFRSNRGQKLTTAIVAILIIIIFSLNFQAVLPLHQSRGQSYAMASGLASIAPDECLVIAYTFDVGKNLLYYYDVETTQYVEFFLLGLYVYGAGYDLPDLTEEKCVVVPLSYVEPGLNFVGFNGYSYPSEWLAFVEWLLNCEYDSQHRLVACNQFEVIVGEEDIYILISSSRTDVDGLQSLFQILDDEIAGASGEQTDTFQAWFSTIYSER